METVRGLDQNDLGSGQLGCDDEKVSERTDLAYQDAAAFTGG
jgi:hypothetical protein